MSKRNKNLSTLYKLIRAHIHTNIQCTYSHRYCTYLTSVCYIILIRSTAYTVFGCELVFECWLQSKQTNWISRCFGLHFLRQFLLNYFIALKANYVVQCQSTTCFPLAYGTTLRKQWIYYYKTILNRTDYRYLDPDTPSVVLQ